MISHYPSRGLTLVELVIVIIIGAVILVPLGAVVVQAANKAFLPEHYTIASGLLEGQIERAANLQFGVLAGDSGVFSGNFSGYSYNRTVYDVTGADLNTLSVSSTDYKRVEVTISRAGFPDVSAVTLVTNN